MLRAAVEATEGAIAEFGAGHGSTPLLHRLAEQQGRRLVTLDNHGEWLERFRAQMESPLHEFRHVLDWEAELARDEWDEPWSVVLVDQQPWEARAATVRRLRDRAEYLVVHDCDYFPREGLLGTEHAPLVGPRDRGERSYEDVFASWREFFPPEPWPFPPTGPPTLAGSNLRDVTTLEVHYDLPLYWRLGRHLRKLVPRTVRLRVATMMKWGQLRPLD